ncbi:MAG: NAD-dependent epimerase/dehydratase family protein, partial [Pseudomonadota bacterium]|nr:NAD-dependent epimerase/dehydratase family protein [Pseudomonadota bacterium]
MNTLIAGGAGFIGLNLAEAILHGGGHVVIYDPGAVPGAAQRTFDELPGSWCHIQKRVNDSEALASTLTEQRIEQVFYGAAVTSGPERERDTPESVLSVNLVGLATVAR